MALSDLQIILIGAGAAAVVAVWAYNIWQERKLRHLSKKIFTHPQDDALISSQTNSPADVSTDVATDVATGVAVNAPVNLPVSEQSADDEETHESTDMAGRKEPTFSAVHDDAVAAIDPPQEISAMPSAAEPASRMASDPAPGAPVVLPAEWADPLTHCVLHLKTTEPTSAPTLWMLQKDVAVQADKPLRWLAHDDFTNGWQKIDERATGRHSHWVAALQLADRRGAVSENALAHFFDGMQRLAHHIGADLSLPDLAPVVAHAAALDAFCATVDIQFKVHIVESAGGVFSGTKLRGIAEAAGMQLEDDGCFHARDSAGEELFTLMNLGSEAFTLENLRSLATHGLSLSLDVPQVSDGPAVFARMLATGQQLARALDGVLVDAQRMPLTDVMTSAIRAKIAELQQTMREVEIVPGSERAHCLFS